MKGILSVEGAACTDKLTAISRSNPRPLLNPQLGMYAIFF